MSSSSTGQSSNSRGIRRSNQTQVPSRSRTSMKNRLATAWAPCVMAVAESPMPVPEW